MEGFLVKVVWLMAVTFILLRVQSIQLIVQVVYRWYSKPFEIILVSYFYNLN